MRDDFATTKLMNACSSAIATIIFVWRGLIDYKLGIVLGVTMFVGATFGAQFVITNSRHMAASYLPGCRLDLGIKGTVV